MALFLGGLLALSPCSGSNNKTTDGGDAGDAADDVPHTDAVDAVADSAGDRAGDGAILPPAAGNSVLERHNHPSRDSLYVQPTLTRAAVARMAFDTAFNPTYPDGVFASPLYLENGPQGKGVFLVATTSNNVYALDETTGATVWMHSIGPSPQNSGAGCGTIHPIGILSTPVIDAQARTIYVAGAIGTTAIDRHEIHALSVDDGSERPGWPVDPSKVSYGPFTFTPQPQNQRSALSLVNGILYVAYGGHNGDCGPYHGWVIAVDTKDPTKIGGWATRGPGEGIWAAGGMASDGTGVFAVTGNSTMLQPAHEDSEEVVHLTGLALLDRSTIKHHFYPAAWSAMDSADQDFGSNSPVYIEIPGATPSKLIAALAKNGHLFLLDSQNLGGLNGQVVDYTLPGLGLTAHGPLAAYRTPLGGMHVVFPTNGGAPCPSYTSGPGLVSIGLSAGSPPQPYMAWCSLNGLRNGPIITTPDGTTDMIVWHHDTGKLIANDGDTGQVLYQDPAPTCANIQYWTTPIAVKGRVIAAASGHLCSWSLRPPPPPDGSTDGLADGPAGN